ncbi:MULTISPECIES: helix-turn-helix domain-containing protein [unclassified Enterococcus]|uniref:helix-turn-helix domain-containing protein n=1 Tax=unclassified Enterococcus TaxID=2608891 RepID=UPI001CE1D5DD|nr:MULTISPECIES: helix-turn-helix domain-containing protein [unclassified Enterococcus]MCA5013466.1 helix-turn-helix domain-containing protein [Enterococcus sp. S23]MCA5016716.1 helix-turn-helix domain-containing protein [Enterococcus sp. S22(2020)]
MKEFMDKSLLRRYQTLELINDAPDQTLHSDLLLDKLGISVGTLYKVISSIENDFIQYDCTDSIKLIYLESIHSYKLEIAEDFFIQFIRLFYYENSLNFKLLKGLLLNNLDDITETAQRFFITYSSLRRELYTLKKEFEKYGLELQLKKKIHLTGNELHIRLFYAVLCLNSYGGYSWPFHSIHLHDTNEILRHMPKEFFNSDSLDKKILVDYFTAVSLVRGRLNFPLTEECFKTSLYHSDTPEFKKSVTDLNQIFKRLLPATTEKKRTLEIRALISCVLACGSYAGITHAPRFFSLDKKLQKDQFLSPLFHIMESLKKYSLLKDSDNEYMKIFNKLATLHYRILLFNNPELQNLPTWSQPKNEIRILSDQRVALFTKIIKKELEHPVFNHLEEYKEYLAGQYHEIFLYSIDWLKYKPAINVLIVSKVSKDKLDFLLTTALRSLYNFQCVFERTEDIDLVVSDTILSDNLIPALGSEAKPVVYVNQTFTLSDYDRVGQKLAHLTWSKIEEKLKKEGLLE